MIPEESRFESDPEELVSDPPLPEGWEIGTPDASDRFEVARLTHLLRAHERHGQTGRHEIVGSSPVSLPPPSRCCLPIGLLTA